MLAPLKKKKNYKNKNKRNKKSLWVIGGKKWVFSVGWKKKYKLQRLETREERDQRKDVLNRRQLRPVQGGEKR